MTPAKQRALVALVEAKDRKFLANAPLMAIVEAVAVLDETGLLALPPDEVERRLLSVLNPPRVGSKRALMYAVRALSWVAGVEWSERPARADAMIVETCDLCGLDDARRSDLQRALDSQRTAGSIVWAEIDGWPFVHPAMGDPAPADSGGDSAPELAPDSVDTPDPPRTHCPRCDAPLDDGRTCTNYPDCPVAEIPF